VSIKTYIYTKLDLVKNCALNTLTSTTNGSLFTGYWVVHSKDIHI